MKNFLKNNYQLVISFILLALILSMCQRNRTLKDNLKTKENNIEVLNDSVTTVHLKNGDLESSILGYKADYKELKYFNAVLANQVKKEKGKVITLNNIVFSLKQDREDLKKFIDSLKTIINQPIQLNDSSWVINWDLNYFYNKDNYDKYSGSTYVTIEGSPIILKSLILKHNYTELTNRDSKISLTWGQKYEDKKIHVFARTSHPAFKTQLLEGTYVDYPKKKHFFTGFGIGPNFTLGYDFLHNQPAIIIGIGIQYNVYQW